MGVDLFIKFNYKRVVFFLLSILCFQGWTIYQEYKAYTKSEVLVLHQTRKSLIFNRNGGDLSILTNPDNTPDYLISDYKTAERIDLVRYDSLKNSYTLEDESLLVIDSAGIYSKSAFHKILLTQSPKINLNRLLDSINPKVIIADGSNYKSYISRWEETCRKNKIPFHYTGEKGAYYFE